MWNLDLSVIHTYINVCIYVCTYVVGGVGHETREDMKRKKEILKGGEEESEGIL